MASTSPEKPDRPDYWARQMADNSDAITEAEQEEFTGWLLTSEQNPLDFRRAVALIQLAADMSPTQQSALFGSGDFRGEHERIARRRNLVKCFGLAASAATVLVIGGLLLGKRESLFEVSHDKTRPFTVKIDDSEEVRATDARVSVKRGRDGGVAIEVLNGSVEVRGPDRFPITIAREEIFVDVESDAARTTPHFLVAYWQWLGTALLLAPLSFLMGRWVEMRRATKLAVKAASEDSSLVVATDTSVADELETRRRRQPPAARDPALP